MIPTIYDHCVPTVPEPWEASDSDNSPPRVPTPTATPTGLTGPTKDLGQLKSSRVRERQENTLQRRAIKSLFEKTRSA